MDEQTPIDQLNNVSPPTIPEKKKSDAASVINAAGSGLSGVASIIGAITGNTPQTTVIQQSSPTETATANKPNFLLWGGIGGGVLLLGLLIFLSSQKK